MAGLVAGDAAKGVFGSILNSQGHGNRGSGGSGGGGGGGGSGQRKDRKAEWKNAWPREQTGKTVEDGLYQPIIENNNSKQPINTFQTSYFKNR